MLAAFPNRGFRLVAPEHDTRQPSADFCDEPKPVVRITPRELAKESPGCLQVSSRQRNSCGHHQRPPFEVRDLPIDRRPFKRADSRRRAMLAQDEDDAANRALLVCRFAAWMAAVECTWPGVEENLTPGRGGAQPEIVVLVHPDRGIERADPIDDAPAKDRREADGVVDLAAREQRERRARDRRRPERTAVERA